MSTESESLARIEGILVGVSTDITETKESLVALDARVKNIERAFYLGIGAIAAAGGGSAILSQFLGG